MSNVITETRLKKQETISFHFTIELLGTLFLSFFVLNRFGSTTLRSCCHIDLACLVQAASEPIIPVALPLSSDMEAHGG